MSELYLLRPATEPDAWVWKRLSGPEGAGNLSRGDQDAARTALRGHRIILVLNGEHISWHSLTLPLKGAKLLAAAPYALEDALAQDIEELHFALAPSSAAERSVLVMQRAWLEAQLDAAQQLEPEEISAAVPDYALLPQAGEHAVLAVSSERWLVQMRDGTGLTIPPASLPGLLSQLQDEGGVSCIEIDGAPPPADLTLLRRAQVEDVLSLVEKPDGLRQATVLQGEFARESRRLQWLRGLRVPAALAASALLLHCVTVFWSAAQVQKQADATYAEAEAAFRQNFPQITRIIDMRVQAEQLLDAANRGGGGSLFLELMAASAKALGRVTDLKLQGVQYRESALFLSLSGSDLQALERLRNQLESEPSLRLEVQSAQAGSDGVQIRLKLEKA